jgi:hypothetical protein
MMTSSTAARGGINLASLIAESVPVAIRTLGAPTCIAEIRQNEASTGYFNTAEMEDSHFFKRLILVNRVRLYCWNLYHHETLYRLHLVLCVGSIKCLYRSTSGAFAPPSHDAPHRIIIHFIPSIATLHE